MALKEKIYWESLALKATSHLPLHCSTLQEPSLETQKAKKASIKKAITKADPYRCFLPIDKENVAAAYLASSNVPFCACQSSAQIKESHLCASTGRMSVDSIVTARTSVDVVPLARTQTSAGSLVGVRRSVDSAITAELPEELLARIQAHLGRRAREGLAIKPSKEKLGSRQYHGECKNVQRVKGPNVHALEKITRSKDNSCKNGHLLKGRNVCAQERISGSKDARCKNEAWEEATNVYIHQRLCSSMDEGYMNGQGVKGSNMHAHQRISRSIDSGLYVKISSSDMPMSMQLYVVRLTKQVFDKQPEHLSLMDTARALKQGLDSQYGYAWHCVVGASYGSYVTHSVGSAIYFYVGNLAILLFKTNLSLHSSSP